MAGSAVRVDAGERVGAVSFALPDGTSAMKRSVVLAAVAGFLVAVFWWVLDVALYLDQHESESTRHIVETGRALTYPVWYLPLGLAVLFVGPFLNAALYAGLTVLVRSVWPAKPRL